MGTLSYSYGRPFGYQGVPGTCLWCGWKLRRKRVMATEAQAGDPTFVRHDGAGYATVLAALPGGYQDGKFCGLRCGYQWAVRAARRAG